MTYIDSSVIREVGVKDENLILVFKGGATYSYSGACEEYSNILRADSAGAYFATIKNKYQYQYLGQNVVI